MPANSPSNPLISIVTPVYNAASFLESTCESVFVQKYTSWELILVDDHSTDGSYDLAKSIAERRSDVRVLQTGTNYGGPAGPRNLGVDAAHGSLVAFLDADDIWLENKLELQLAVLQESGAAMSSTKAQRFRHEVELRPVSATGRPRWSEVSFRQNQIKNRIVTSSVIAKREFLLRHRFNESRKYRAVEDYDCWLRIIDEAGFCAKLDSPLLGYRICDSQISANKMDMARKVFRVHWNYGRLSAMLAAPLLTLTHGGTGLFQRLTGRSV